MLLTEPGVRYFQRRTGVRPGLAAARPGHRCRAPAAGRLAGPPTLGLEDLLSAVRGTQPA